MPPIVGLTVFLLDAETLAPQRLAYRKLCFGGVQVDPRVAGTFLTVAGHIVGSESA